MQAEKSIQNVNQKARRSGTQFCDTQKFKSIPKEDRPAYIQKMLAVQQLPGPPPFSFKKPYLSQSKFPYKGYNLHYYSSESSLTPKAVLFYFHGMNGHARNLGYFNNSIKEYVAEMNVYACDQMNFGKSEGSFRGLITSLDDTVEQCEKFVEYILSKLENKTKIFISGGSFGGTICFRMAIRAPEKYSGIIFLGPGLRQLSAKFMMLKYAAKIMACLLPPVRLYTEKQFNTSTRYNNKQQIIAQKLIYNDGAIPHTGNAILNGMNSVSTQYHLLTTPYILFQGGVDKMIDPFAAIDLEEASPSKDKTTLYCEGMWHALHAQREIQEIAEISKKWIKDRL